MPPTPTIARPSMKTLCPIPEPTVTMQKSSELFRRQAQPRRSQIVHDAYARISEPSLERTLDVERLHVPHRR